MPTFKDSLKRAVVSIQGVKIPEMPEEVMLLQKELNSKFANSAAVAGIIEKNATISGEVIRMANSPASKLPQPVTSIRQAVDVLGMNRLYNLVVSAALNNCFSGKKLLKDILDNSVDVAFCMTDLADWVDDVSRDEAYMLGLFHNVGALLLASKDERKYEAFYMRSMSMPNRVLSEENVAYGSNHAMAGVLVAKKWILPNEMIQAIMLHHNSACENISNPKIRAMVAMLKIANILVAEISMGAFLSDEARNYMNDGIQELLIPDEVVSEIRTALLSYSFKC